MKEVYSQMGLLITIHNNLPKYNISKSKFSPLDKIDFEHFLHTHKTLHDQLILEYGVEFD
jgi:hypothetical protein